MSTEHFNKNNFFMFIRSEFSMKTYSLFKFLHIMLLTCKIRSSPVNILEKHSLDLLTASCHHHTNDKQTFRRAQLHFNPPICSLRSEQTEKAGVEEWKMSGERWNLTIYFKFLQTLSADEFYRKSLINYLGINVYGRRKLPSSVTRISKADN